MSLRDNHHQIATDFLIQIVALFSPRLSRYTPPEIEDWIEHCKAGMENALRAKPEDVREQHEREIKALQEAYGEAMLELRARKKLQSLLGKEEP